MAPFSKAVNSQLNNGKSCSQKGGHEVRVYTGDIDSDWSVGSVPHGGYLLALIVDVCIQSQSTTAHKDPIHLTAHFLRRSNIEPYEVRVRTIKCGKGFTNLTADLLQKGETKVTSHLIFGINAPSIGQQARISLDPPSPYARQIPLHLHPSKCTPSPFPESLGFLDHIKTTMDSVIVAKNRINSAMRTTSSTVGGGGLECGGWLEFVDKNERITTSSLAFLVDIFMNTPRLLPRNFRDNLGESWFPTMVLSIEFRSPIPLPSTVHAHRTVGIYSIGRFSNDPDNRHDSHVEVWTAPSNVGEGTECEDWRTKQVCLATATQMSIAVPYEVNEVKGKVKAKM